MGIHTVVAWLPVLVLPIMAAAFTPQDWPRWAFMWLFAWTIYFGCKWLTWRLIRPSVSTGLQMGYLVTWPGMDAAAFFFTPNREMPSLGAWLFALAKFSFGIALLRVAIALLPMECDLLRGWVGMIGILFVLHFGIFHLLSLAWRALGFTAKPVMNWPILATSVSDFWGRRWNTAFRDLTHRFLFRPLTARFGARAALAVGFLVSGILHDLVVSFPAGAGYGGPTVFFLVQAAAIFCERSTLGKRLGLGRGVIGWAFTMAVLAGPLVLLFHPPFVREIIVPFVDWLGRAAAFQEMP